MIGSVKWHAHAGLVCLPSNRCQLLIDQQYLDRNAQPWKGVPGEDNRNLDRLGAMDQIRDEAAVVDVVRGKQVVCQIEIALAQISSIT